MLVLSRTIGQGVVLPGLQTRVSILEVKGKRVRLGVQAPPDIAVHRDETWEKIRSQSGDASSGSGRSNPQVDVMWFAPGTVSRQSLIEDAATGLVRVRIVSSLKECRRECTLHRPDMLALTWTACGAAADFLKSIAAEEELATIPVLLMPTSQVAGGLDLELATIVQRMQLSDHRAKSGHGLTALAGTAVARRAAATKPVLRQRVLSPK